MQLFDLSGKVIIITGSTRGIGLGIAGCLAASGAQVIISSRSQPDCDAIAGRLNAQFPATSSYGVACDVADGDSIGDLIAEVVRRSGGLMCSSATPHGCRVSRRSTRSPTASSSPSSTPTS